MSSVCLVFVHDAEGSTFLSEGRACMVTTPLSVPGAEGSANQTSSSQGGHILTHCTLLATLHCKQPTSPVTRTQMVTSPHDCQPRCGTQQPVLRPWLCLHTCCGFPPAGTWVSSLSGRLRAPLSVQVLSSESSPGILVQAVSHPGSLTGPGPLRRCPGQAECVRRRHAGVCYASAGSSAGSLFPEL